MLGGLKIAGDLDITTIRSQSGKLLIYAIKYRFLSCLSYLVHSPLRERQGIDITMFARLPVCMLKSLSVLQADNNEHGARLKAYQS